jgi:hypothetical protein
VDLLRNHFSSLAVLAVFVGGSVAAAPMMPVDAAANRPGQAIHQQFLDSGASIVTTRAGRACMVSRRIDIETSAYLDPEGTPVPFAAIRRSPAASVQAGEGGEGAVWYRLQMKYPLDRAEPVTLRADGQEIDLRPMLEPSGDSLNLTGEAAARLAAAFAAGGQPTLEAWSADTGHRVTDRLETPDVAALSACVVDLPTAAQAPILTNEVRVSFAGTPDTAPLATLPDLRACGMAEPPGKLHLVRLDSVTGFFAHTDRAFVAFDEGGRVERFYISGIFDADIHDQAGTARLSRAADANLPDAENAVKGCLGAASQRICSYDTGKGNHLLADCFDPFGVSGLPSGIPTTGGPPTRTATLLPPGGGPGGPGGPGSPPGGNPPGGGGGTAGDDDSSPPPPSPVPLPGTGLLLLGALGAAVALRRRKTG